MNGNNDHDRSVDAAGDDFDCNEIEDDGDWKTVTHAVSSALPWQQHGQECFSLNSFHQGFLYLTSASNVFGLTIPEPDAGQKKIR